MKNKNELKILTKSDFLIIKNFSDLWDCLEYKFPLPLHNINCST